MTSLSGVLLYITGLPTDLIDIIKNLEGTKEKKKNKQKRQRRKKCVDKKREIQRLRSDINNGRICIKCLYEVTSSSNKGLHSRIREYNNLQR